MRHHPFDDLDAAIDRYTDLTAGRGDRKHWAAIRRNLAATYAKEGDYATQLAQVNADIQACADARDGGPTA